MTDIEIARNTKLDKIKKIAKKLNINEEYLEEYAGSRGVADIQTKKDGSLREGFKMSFS